MADTNPFSDPDFGAEPNPVPNPFANPDFGKEASLTERVGYGFKRAVSATRAALTDDPNKIAQLTAEQAQAAPPQSAVARQMQEEIKPYVEAANKSEGLVDGVKTWGALGFKRAGQLLSNPGEAGKMIAEQLPNSLPGLAGSVAGAKGGAAVGSVFGPIGTAVGAVVGGIGGGIAGGYLTEKGSSIQEQVQQKAQAQGVNIQDQAAVAKLVTANQPEIDSAASMKGIATAGTDAVLNALTLGMSGAGRRVLANEINALGDAVKAGTATAADAAKQVAVLEARAVAQNALPATLARGAGITAAEMAGEGISEAVGQKLAYGSVDAGDVVDESLLGLGQGVAMSAASGAVNKIGGTPTVDDNQQKLTALRESLVQPDAPPLQLGNTEDPMLGFPDGTVARRSEFEAYVNGLPEDQRVAARAQAFGFAPQGQSPEQLAQAQAAAEAAAVAAGAAREQSMVRLQALSDEEFSGLQANLDAPENAWARSLLANPTPTQEQAQAAQLAAPADDGQTEIAQATGANVGQPRFDPAPTGNTLTGNTGSSLMRQQLANGDPLRTVKPSVAMGLNPDAGPMSAAATLAVDGGLTGALAQARAAAQAQALAQQKPTGKTADRPQGSVSGATGQSLLGGQGTSLAGGANPLQAAIARIRSEKANAKAQAQALGPQATQGQAARVEAPAPVGGDGAAAAGLPAARGAAAAPAGLTTGAAQPVSLQPAVNQELSRNGTQTAQAQQATPQGPTPQPPATELGQQVAAAANVAATSPLNDRPQPSAKQQEAGNYAKGHVQFDGLDLTVENPVGSMRSGTDPNGKPWSVGMTAHYGYLKRTQGADGDQVDVYLANDPVPGSPVFVIDQFNADGTFDEHKAVAGVATQAEAEAIYDAHFSDGSGPSRRRGVKAMTPTEFKAWASKDAAQGPVQAQAAEEQKAGATKKKPENPGRRMRLNAWQVNPMRAFLGEHGIHSDLAAEFAPGAAERRKAMVPGFGPIFRRSGKQLDELSSLARESGFIREDDVAELYPLIERSIRGERIAPLYAEGVAEREMARTMQARYEDFVEQAQAEQVDDPFAPLLDAGFTEEDIAAAGYGAAAPDLVAQVRALQAQLEAAGLDPEDILERFALQFPDLSEDQFNEQLQAVYQQALADKAQPRSLQDAGGPADGQTQSPGQRDQAGELQNEGELLTSPTRADIEAQQDRAEAAARQQATDQQRAEQDAADARERAEVARRSQAAADTFELGQDPMANLTGQQDIFGVSQQEPATAPQPKPAAPRASQPKTETPAAPAIEDLGEKIGGARKDTARATGTRSAKKDDDRPAWARRFQIAQIVKAAGRDAKDEGRWVISDTRNTDWMKQPKQVGGSFATREEAEAAVPLAAVSLKHRVVPSRDGQWEIWRDITDRKRVKVVDQVFASRDEAMSYMAQNAVSILETSTTFGEADLPLSTDLERVGIERRTGDVAGQDFMDAFGFRGVEFGNWNNQVERQQVMNAAYDGLLDLAEVLNLPPKAISLNGDLALAFGARGHGLSGARAHYEPGKAVINLTKMNGAGALAHEWFHALDHYFGRQDGKASSTWETDADGTRSLMGAGVDDMATEGMRGERSGVRAEVRTALRNVLQVMTRKAETYVEDTQKVDRFVGQSRDEVRAELERLRRDLAQQLDPRYYTRKNAPATAEQLAEFDTIAEQLVQGVGLETTYRPVAGTKSLTGGRWTNEALEKLSAINKAVRGRTGFNAERTGTLDRLRGHLGRYEQRLKMLADAQVSTEKTRAVPTDFAMDARSLDQGRGTDYWTTIPEMAARAFQGYVEDKVSGKGGKSPFLNHAPENAGILTPWGWKRPFPAGEERKAINAAFDRLLGEFKTRETEQGTAIFSRPMDMETLQRMFKPLAPLSVTETQVAVADLVKGWKNGPRLRVVATPADLPANAPADTRGQYLNGTAYLVASNHRSAGNVLRTLAHEVVAHYGLRQMLGGIEFQRMMRNIQQGLARGDSALLELQEQVRAAYRDEAGNFNLSPSQEADEIAARAVEVGFDVNTGQFRTGFEWVKRIYSRIAQFLRNLGFDVRFTNAELQGMLARSQRFLTAPARPGESLVLDGELEPALGRSAMKSLDANIARGREAMNKAILDRADVNRAMYRSDLGWVDFVWGDDKKGIRHILRQRQIKDGMSEGSVVRMLVDDIVQTIGGGTAVRQVSVGNVQRVTVRKNGTEVQLVRRDGANGWLLTGYETKPSDATGAGFDATGATQAAPTLARRGLGADGPKNDTPVAGGDSILPTTTQNVSNATTATDSSATGPAGAAASSRPADAIRARVIEAGRAAGESGNAPPAGPDGLSGPAFARGSAGQWETPAATRFDNLVYKLQDKNIDTKRVQEAIAATTQQIRDDLNVYLQEELFHGRAASRVKDFSAHELGPLATQMRTLGLEITDVEEFLHARHAREANALIASREPSMPDGGSGMTNAAADAYMRALPAVQRRKLEAVANKVDAIIAQTRQLYADYGLEDQATVDGWGTMFKAYVPLMREDKDGGMGIGQGFSVKGKEVKGRTGSTRKVVDILANVAMQRERVIVRGEKNRVGQALMGLAQANPNPDFWEVRSQPPTERVYDPKTNRVVDRPDTMFKNQPNVVTAKVKDASGKVTEQAVVFNEGNDRAVRMAVAMKNLDTANLEGLLGVSAKITRYFAAVNTQYNPVFGVVNLVRDVQGAMVNLAATPLAGKQIKIARDTLSALGGIYRDVRATRKGGQATSPWAQLWEQMQADGGTTGYRELFKTSAERAENLKSIINPDAWMDTGWGRVFTADGRLKVPVGMAVKAAKPLFDWLSDYNEAMENGVRLASYKAALDQGMSRQQAASLAKNLTVNFNRKGQVGQQAGALYAFFNAAMQGTARMGETLVDMEGGRLKTMRLSSVGRRVVYGGLMLGSIQALALAAAGFDDEDPPEFVRERSLIIPTGGKTYVSIPMPLGLHVIPGLGRHATEFALSGFEKPAKRVIDVVGMFADAFNPIGNAGLSIQTIAPTPIDPLVALSENRDWTGKPIARTSNNPAMPGHSQWKDTATGWSKAIAEGINWISGGNQYVAGALSPTPDQIDYLIAQITGGVGREISKIEQTGRALSSGEELPTYKVPLLGRFVGNAASQASEGNAFYANVQRINEVETELKGLRKDGKGAQAAELLRTRPEARLIMAANLAERQVQKLRRDKRDLIEKGADREAVKAKDEEITAVMARLNRAAGRATAP